MARLKDGRWGGKIILYLTPEDREKLKVIARLKYWNNQSNTLRALIQEKYNALNSNGK